MTRVAAFLMALGVAARLSAQDAQTVPPGSLWWRAEAAFLFANDSYDDGGDRHGSVAPSRDVTLGIAAELGLTDRISVELDWLPGYDVWSTLDGAGESFFPDGQATRDGPGDLWAAARFQIIGDFGFALRSERLRLTAAPGLVVPLPEPDWKTQAERALDGKRYVFETPDRHALGAGLRLAFEYVVADSFSVRARASYVQFATRRTESAQSPNVLQDTDYGYRLALAVEPQASLDLGRVALRAGLELKDVLVPEALVDGTIAVQDGFLATAQPWAGIVFAARANPLLLSVGYTVPLAGRNGEAQSGIRVSIGSAPAQGR